MPAALADTEPLAAPSGGSARERDVDAGARPSQLGPHLHTHARAPYWGRHDADAHELKEARAQDLVDGGARWQADELLDVRAVQEGLVCYFTAQY